MMESIGLGRNAVVKVVMALLMCALLTHCDSNSSVSDSPDDVTNPPNNFTFVDSDGNPVTSVPDNTVLVLQSSTDNTPVLSFTANGTVDFTNVTAGLSSDKAWVHFPSESDKAGITGNVTLYIPATADSTSVRICPGAAALDEISDECENGITLTTDSPSESGYTWANPSRSGTAPFEITCDIATFSTGGMGLSETPPVETMPSLTAIAISPTSATLLIGDTQHYTAIGTYTDLSTADITTSVTWHTSSSTTATISAVGLATGVAVGNTTLTATLDAITSNSSTLTVANPLVSIAITPTSPSVAIASTQQFIATGTYADSSTATLTTSASWNSSNPSAATIGLHTGLASGVATGSTTITAVQDGVTSNAVTLTVTNPLVSIAISPTSPSITITGTQQFTATGTYADSSTATLTTSASWNSTNPSAATIGLHTGLASGVATGSTTITAAQDGVTSNSAVLSVLNFAYITNGSSNAVYSCAINNEDGTLSACVSNSIAPGDAPPYGVAINPARTFAYVSNYNTGTVSYCAIHPTNGQLNSCSDVNTSFGGAWQLAINPEGTFVYVPRAGNNSITYCEVNAMDGSLSNCTAAITGLSSTPFGLAFSPTLDVAYITNLVDNTISVCTINPDGTLSSCATTGSAFSSPVSIAIDPENAFAYITNMSDDSVTICPVDPADGTLGSVSSPCVAVNGSGIFRSPYGLAINADGTFLYVGNHGNATVSICDIADGVLSACMTTGNVTFNGPDSIAIH